MNRLQGASKALWEALAGSGLQSPRQIAADLKPADIANVVAALAEEAELVLSLVQMHQPAQPLRLRTLQQILLDDASTPSPALLNVAQQTVKIYTTNHHAQIPLDEHGIATVPEEDGPIPLAIRIHSVIYPVPVARRVNIDGTIVLFNQLDQELAYLRGPDTKFPNDEDTRHFLKHIYGRGVSLSSWMLGGAEIGNRGQLVLQQSADPLQGSLYQRLRRLLTYSSRQSPYNPPILISSPIFEGEFTPFGEEDFSQMDDVLPRDLTDEQLVRVLHDWKSFGQSKTLRDFLNPFPLDKQGRIVCTQKDLFQSIALGPTGLLTQCQRQLLCCNSSVTGITTGAFSIERKGVDQMLEDIRTVGGVVHPDHLTHYITGSCVWTGEKLQEPTRLLNQLWGPFAGWNALGSIDNIREASQKGELKVNGRLFDEADPALFWQQLSYVLDLIGDGTVIIDDHPLGVTALQAVADRAISHPIFPSNLRPTCIISDAQEKKVQVPPAILETFSEMYRTMQSSRWKGSKTDLASGLKVPFELATFQTFYDQCLAQLPTQAEVASNFSRCLHYFQCDSAQLPIAIQHGLPTASPKDCRAFTGEELCRGSQEERVALLDHTVHTLHLRPVQRLLFGDHKALPMPGEAFLITLGKQPHNLNTLVLDLEPPGLELFETEQSIHWDHCANPPPPLICGLKELQMYFSYSKPLHDHGGPIEGTLIHSMFLRMPDLADVKLHFTPGPHGPDARLCDIGTWSRAAGQHQSLKSLSLWNAPDLSSEQIALILGAPKLEHLIIGYDATSPAANILTMEIVQHCKDCGIILELQGNGWTGHPWGGLRGILKRTTSHSTVEYS